MSPRVLIVDDERRNRMLLEAMLAPEEFALSTASSGEEALASVAQDPPDLILLDVLMPGMGGYEVADMLKRDLATRHIPIIMVSALDDHDARMSGLTAGAEDFLTRPVDRAELCIRVRNLLRLKAASDIAIAERDTSMGMVSHDLRNLLHGIVLQATMLAEADADAEVADVRRAAGLRRILDHATRMGRLVEDLVDVVRINAGKLALESAPHDAVTLLADTLDAFAADAAKRGVELRVDPGARTLVATFDRARVLQVLGNLV
ncbi:MAG: response regulator, partial [Proteobacteria bacterium]|nr:response regulator [Pseudomonadota bacterium]